MLKRSEVYLFSCPECMKDFWVTEDECVPFTSKEGRHALHRCPSCGDTTWLKIEFARGDEVDWDLGDEVEPYTRELINGL